MLNKFINKKIPFSEKSTPEEIALSKAMDKYLDESPPIILDFTKVLKITDGGLKVLDIVESFSNESKMMEDVKIKRDNDNEFMISNTSYEEEIENYVSEYMEKVYGVKESQLYYCFETKKFNLIPKFNELDNTKKKQLFSKYLESFVPYIIAIEVSNNSEQKYESIYGGEFKEAITTKCMTPLWVETTNGTDIFKELKIRHLEKITSIPISKRFKIKSINIDELYKAMERQKSFTIQDKVKYKDTNKEIPGAFNKKVIYWFFGLSIYLM